MVKLTGCHTPSFDCKKTLASVLLTLSIFILLSMKEAIYLVASCPQTGPQDKDLISAVNSQ